MKTNNLFIASIIFIALISCNKSQPTEQNKTYNLKEIHEDSNWVEVTDTVSIDISCLNQDSLVDLRNFVIKDSNEYSLFKNLIWRYHKCLNYELPQIDFNRYSLLGLVTRTGFCEITKKVFINNAEKKYLYIIEITQKGSEKILAINKNWLLIPKIPYQFSVLMDTLRINY